MAQRLVVPDASVILKWVLPSGDEPDLGPALALRDSIAEGHVRAIVPALWIYEVGNTLARRQPDRAERSLGALLRFDLESALQSPMWLECVLDLTRRYGVTFYDASYHAPCDRGTRNVRDRGRALRRARGRGRLRDATLRVDRQRRVRTGHRRPLMRWRMTSRSISAKDA